MRWIFSPATTGDLVVVEVPECADGQSQPRYHLAKVDLVDAAGRLVSATRPSSCPAPHVFSHGEYGESWIVDQRAIGEDVDNFLMRLGEDVAHVNFEDIAPVLTVFTEDRSR